MFEICMNPGAMKSWKKLTVMALVFDDATHRHEADSALFHEFAQRRHEIGALSPEENRRLAAAQRAQELAADKANYLKAREQATAEYAALVAIAKARGVPKKNVAKPWILNDYERKSLPGLKTLAASRGMSWPAVTNSRTKWEVIRELVRNDARLNAAEGLGFTVVG